MMFRRTVALLGSVVLMALVGCGVYAWSNGVRGYFVDSGSMSPTIPTGALVIDERVEPAMALHVGDIVTFHPTPGYTVTHRVADISAAGIATKGDANPNRDVGTIRPDLIVGRVVFSIPYAGYVVVFFQHPIWIAGLLLLLLTALAAWQLTGSQAPLGKTTSTIGEDPA